MNELELLERITLNPQILNGQPVIRGSQVLVEQILGMLAMGETLQAIMENPEKVYEALQNALVDYPQYGAEVEAYLDLLERVDDEAIHG